MKEQRVLVVEFEPSARSQIADWLSNEGYGILTCRGPFRPDYTCPGGRNEACGLAELADVVVLDMRLASDEMMRGTPGWHLLTYYVERGKRIVALSGEDDTVVPLPDDQVIVLRRPVARKALLAAVASQVSRTYAGAS